MVTKEGKSCSCAVKPELAKQGKGSTCPVCGKPATELVDGEPSCKDHIEQVYAPRGRITQGRVSRTTSGARPDRLNRPLIVGSRCLFPTGRRRIICPAESVALIL